MLEESKKAIMLGYSGHAYVVYEAAILSGLQILGYVDVRNRVQNPFQIEYLGYENDADFDWKITDNYILAVGDNLIRSLTATRVKSNGGKCMRIIHPDASISKYSIIGSGTFVAKNVAINPLVNIGENVIINTSSSIDHECIIKDNVHIAPGAVLAGDVEVGYGVFIGANAVIREGIKIGENSIIGAGAVVLKDVQPNSIIVGNPGINKK